MGVFTVRIEVGDPAGTRFETYEALVDTGSTNTTMPASVLKRLGVQPHKTATFELADGRQVEMGIGRAWVRLNGDQELTQVAFAEEDTEPLLGAITLEEFGLGVDPLKKILIPLRRMRK
jgi:clan AA aspartic protease